MKYEPANTKERILVAAAELFARDGYERTTYEAIRKQAKAALGSVTHHFGNKSQIATAVYDRAANSLITTCTVPLERQAPNHGVTVRALQHAYSNWMETHPAYAGVLRALDATITAMQDPSVLPVQQRLIALIARWAEPLRRRKIAAFTPAELYASFLGPIDCAWRYVEASPVQTAGWPDLAWRMAMLALEPPPQQAAAQAAARRKSSSQRTLFESSNGKF